MSRKRPAPVVVEPIRARAIRGPNADGAWYWRAELFRGERRQGRTVWVGWSHRDALADTLKAIDTTAKDGSEERAEEPAEVEALLTVRALMETWVNQQEQRADVSKVRALMETWVNQQEQ